MDYVHARDVSIAMDETGFPCYYVTDKDREELESAYLRQFGNSTRLNVHTVLCKPDSRKAGILGEIVFKKIYGDGNSPSHQSIDWEQGLTVDIKCKLRTVPPEQDYTASYPYYQSGDFFVADILYFMSTTSEYDRVWLCGWMSKEEILSSDHSVLHRTGEIDPANNFKFLTDTICIMYRHLHPVDLRRIRDGSVLDKNVSGSVG